MDIFFLSLQARVETHVLARVVTHVLARVIMHVHDYYLKTCVQGGHTAKASTSVDCLSTVYPELITCRADLPPTTRTRFHSVLQQGGALPLVQQAAEQQSSVQEGCEVPLLQSRGHLERE